MMYAAVHNLLGDRKGGAVFTCFGPWHLCYIAAILLTIAIVFAAVRRKGAESGRKAANTFLHIAAGLYAADFFLMPFAYGEIDIEKLPFHICTAMCVAAFLSVHTRFLAKYRIHIALLGFLSNLIYLVYPAGVMWYAVHPLSYRVIQTLLFHGMMTAYGFFAVWFDEKGLSWRTCWRELVTVVCMTLWALLGNTLYNGRADGYDHFFNWFFVVRDPFGLIDPAVSPYIMPFLNTAAFFAVEMLLYVLYFAGKRAAGRKTRS
jgi:hypothetical protein